MDCPAIIPLNLWAVARDASKMLAWYLAPSCLFHLALGRVNGHNGGAEAAERLQSRGAEVHGSAPLLLSSITRMPTRRGPPPLLASGAGNCLGAAMLSIKLVQVPIPRQPELCPCEQEAAGLQFLPYCAVALWHVGANHSVEAAAPGVGLSP